MKAPARSRAMRCAHLLGRERRGQERGGHAARLERVDLVVHQRDERRDHERRPGQEARRELVGQALAAARGRDQQQPASLEQRLDRLALARPEGLVAEPRQAAVQIQVGHGLDHSGPPGQDRTDFAGIGYSLRMWLWLAAGVLFADAPVVASSTVSGLYATTLPAPVGDVSSWSIVTGEFETSGERGSYLFYVNPTRGALYQLMRYRVELRQAESAEERQRGTAERVAFIPRPGVREPMLCWERLAGTAPVWREVAAGTAAYVLEMQVLMRVLAAHRAARLPPSTP